MLSKSKKIRINRRTGKSYMWTIEITVPAGRGRKNNDGLNARDKFVLTYMKSLFTIIENSLEVVGGYCRIYKGDE
jgi:hypothetical protein